VQSRVGGEPEAALGILMDTPNSVLPKGATHLIPHEVQVVQVADTPGLWLVLRGALEEGTAADHAKVNAMLEKLAPKQAPPKPAGKPASGKPASSAAGAAPTSTAMHTSLMQIQQQTFNTWQWAMGFKSTMFGY
jgi:hypothetical protein